MSSNVFDKCALALGACAGLQRLELSSGVQLPATLKQAPVGVPLGLHIAEEAQVGRVCGCRAVPGCTWPGGRQTGWEAEHGQSLLRTGAEHRPCNAIAPTSLAAPPSRPRCRRRSRGRGATA